MFSIPKLIWWKSILIFHILIFHRSMKHPFIGLRDINGDKKFTWIDGSSDESDFANWAPGEPNNNNERCGGIWTIEDKEDAGKWNDITCSYSRPYICKRNAPGVAYENGKKEIV